MIEHCFARPSVITQLRYGPLGTHLEALATTLHQHGYAPDSIRRTLRAGEQFGRWLSQHGYAIADVDKALVERYIRTLPPPPVGRWPKAAEGLPHLLRLWRQRDLSQLPAVPQRGRKQPSGLCDTHSTSSTSAARHPALAPPICGSPPACWQPCLASAACSGIPCQPRH